MLKPVGMCIYIILNALRVRVKSGEIIDVVEKVVKLK